VTSPSATDAFSVILCTRNRAQLLGPAIAAVQAALREGDELVVVDSASDTDETAEVARAAGVTVLRADRPGLSVARNLGLTAASRPLIAFTDDDCRPAPDWLTRLAGPFADAGTGVATGAVRADEGELRFHDEPEPRRFTFPTDPIEMGAGANMAFRREALDAVGGFDERIGAGTRLRSAEDHDAFWRVLRAGWTGAYVPDAVVSHHDWRDRWQIARLGWGTGLGTGAFVAKAIRAGTWREGQPLLATRLGRRGILAFASNVAKRWEVPALAEALKLTGTVAGFAVGAVLPIDGTRFRPRR
jgi:glycosyltransferase involved in cell wall biosynthesis